MRTIVTGGAGFIGTNLVYALARSGAEVLVVDKLTYAGCLESLDDARARHGVRFEQLDICEGAKLRALIAAFRPDTVFHLAAESHVDRSIDGPGAFVRTNVTGTFEVLEACRHHVAALDAADRQRFRVVHVSTDEVFGSLGATGAFHEETPYAPNSPYAATKAASDHLARAYVHTYALPLVTTNCSNNYGPYQFPEKLLPLMIKRALAGQPLPVYGDGLQVRDWLFVGDHCEALMTVANRGRVGETYNIGGNAERTNLEVVHTLTAILDDLRPAPRPYAQLIQHVADRPGHDRRYAMNIGKISQELGWKPAIELRAGLEATVRWYLDNPAWSARIESRGYQGERLGLTSPASQGVAP